MQYAYIGLRSLTYAQGAARLLEKRRFHVTVARMPLQAESTGCAYSVRLRANEVDAALPLLKAEGLETGKVYYPPAGGGGEETPRRRRAGGP